MVTTLETIDNHLTRTWLQLKNAEAKGRPVTEYRHMIDTLLDQRLKYTNV